LTVHGGVQIALIGAPRTAVFADHRSVQIGGYTRAGANRR
jgi:hypothetical protein